MNVDFTTAAELLAICKKEVISPGDYEELRRFWEKGGGEA